MIDTRAVGQELQDLQHQIAGRIRKGQESVTDAIKTWTQVAQAARPQIPSLPKPETLAAKLPKPETLAAKLPKPEALAARLPSVDVLTARLAKSNTLVTGAYDLAGQFVADQRKLVRQVVHAAGPLARQGAAILGYGTATPGQGTQRSAEHAVTGKAGPVKAGPVKAEPVKAEPVKAQAPKTAAAPKSTAAKAVPPKAATAPKSTAPKSTAPKSTAPKSTAAKKARPVKK